MRHTLKTIIGTALAAGMLTATVGVLPAFAEAAQAAPATSVVVTSGAAHAAVATSVVDPQSAAEPYETDPSKDSDVKSVEHDGLTEPWQVAIIAALVFIISGGVSILGYRMSRRGDAG